MGRESFCPITLTPESSINRFLLSRAAELVATDESYKNYIKVAGGTNGMRLKDGSIQNETGYVMNSSDCLWQVNMISIFSMIIPNFK